MINLIFVDFKPKNIASFHRSVRQRLILASPSIIFEGVVWLVQASRQEVELCFVFFTILKVFSINSDSI